MSLSADQFDAIIIGAGQAGPPLAHKLGSVGWSVALIERRYVGGTCINDGCTPTKTMVASAKMAHLARRAAEYGVEVGDVRVDIAKILERKNSVVQSFRQSSRQSLQAAENIELIMGEARFHNASTLVVTLNDSGRRRRLAAPTIIINTGARPRQPDIAGLASIDPLTSTTLMQLPEVPGHLLVLGGGYVGLEFGQMYRRFGSEVSIIQRSSQLLTREDQDLAAAITEILREDGIRVYLGTEAVSVSTTPDEAIKVELDSGEGPKFITGSHLLLAAGRVPNTEALNLEAAGVELDDGGSIKVDDQLRTNVDGIYAVGDVKGGPAFTHISYDDYRVLSANLLESAGQSIRDRLVPYTVYTDPQLGRVGLTERQAQQAGIEYKIAKLPMTSVARAIEVGETRGLLKALVSADDDRILGVAFLGMDGGELMSAVQLAMMGDLPYTALRDTVFAHPTLTESLNNLFGSLT